MGRESLWGWLGFGVLSGMVAVAVIVLSTNTVTLLAGILLGVVAGVVLQVTTIGIGVQAGMTRHEHLQRRR